MKANDVMKLFSSSVRTLRTVKDGFSIKTPIKNCQNQAKTPKT
jgi:hypothetical protein